MSSPRTLHSLTGPYSTFVLAGAITYLVANPHLGTSAAEACVRVIVAFPAFFAVLTGPCAMTLEVNGGTLTAKGFFTDTVIPVRDIAGVVVLPTHPVSELLGFRRRIRIFAKDGRAMVEVDAFRWSLERFLAELAAEARAVSATTCRPLVRPRSGYVWDVVSVAAGVALPCLLDHLVVAGVLLAAGGLVLGLVMSWASLAATATEATDDFPDDPDADTGLAPWKRALARG